MCQRVQTGPHTQDRTDGDLVCPRDPAVAAGDELCRRVGGITVRGSRQLGVFIRHETDTEGATHIDNLWCAGGSVGTIWGIDGFAIAPGLTVIG